jgi:hypothetical protein
VSNSNQDFSGSAARQNEGSGGNVPAGKINLPVGGDAARKAEAEGDAINEAHGAGTVPRGQYRGAGPVRLPPVRGARLVAEDAKPDLSNRKASDYLPPQLKAQLIAEGKLSAEGEFVEPPTRPPEPPPAVTGEEPPAGIFASLSRFFRELFS